MNGSYLDPWASWAARWLAASMVVKVGACSWSTADRGGPLPASHACAETSMWDSVPLPGPRRGRLEVRCVTLTVPVDDADPGRGSLGVAMIRVRSADQHDRIGSFVLDPAGAGLSALGYLPVRPSWPPDTWSYGARLALHAYLFPDRVRTPIRTVLERSPCVARQVTLYLDEVRVPGGHAC